LFLESSFLSLTSLMQATFLFSPPDYGKDIIWDDSANPPEVRGGTPEKLVEKLSHETYYGKTLNNLA
jgi:hypothetical protein